MQIGAVAKKAAVSVQTVWFYERQGLLPSPPRKESGYRLYGEADLKRLLFIRQAKALGFSLEEIRMILRMCERGQCPCASVLRLAEQHLETTERQISQLAAFVMSFAARLGNGSNQNGSSFRRTPSAS